VSWLRPGLDEAAVFAFDTQLRELHPFTKDPEELKKAAGELLPPFGQTAIYDAIAAAAKRVAERANTRRGVLVLTDGVDTKSRLKPADVSAIASGIDVPVYVMAVVTPVDHPGAEFADSNADASALKGALSDLADWTGGSIFVASTPAHYSVAARRLLDELRHQYLIAFEASPSAGWRRLEIRTRDRDLVVRARSGYVAGNGNSQE
jgi:VWFA-related protein